MDGILNIDKPSGRTSFSVVAEIRRRTGEKRVGHAGTLDPAATGVLPVCLGRATRIIEYMTDAVKTYRARIELGVTTDTYDGDGTVTGGSDPSGIDRERLEVALAGFRGSIRQTPPMYSAVKHQGKRLYQLARAGIEVARSSRPAQIHRLDLLDWEPPFFTLEVACGKGTYIRSLAHDLGQALGCGACLQGLVRTRYGIFDVGNAVTIPKLGEAFHFGYWPQLLYPVDAPLQQYGSVIVGEAEAEIISRGGPLSLEADPGRPENQPCRAYSGDGRFLAMLRYSREKGYWQPKKVLA